MSPSRRLPRRKRILAEQSVTKITHTISLPVIDNHSLLYSRTTWSHSVTRHDSILLYYQLRGRSSEGRLRNSRDILIGRLVTALETTVRKRVRGTGWQRLLRLWVHRKQDSYSCNGGRPISSDRRLGWPHRREISEADAIRAEIRSPSS